MKLKTEATIQAELYHLCKLASLSCACQVVTPAGVLDVLVFDPEKREAIAIVECKATKEKAQRANRSRQVARYKTLGVPVLTIGAIEEAGAISATLVSLAAECGPRIHLEAIASGERPACWPKRRRLKPQQFIDPDLCFKP